MVEKRQYFVQVLGPGNGKVLYVGTANYLRRSIYENKNGITGGFTTEYHENRLLYYDVFGDINRAITREKQLKAGNRKKKELQIENANMNGKDLQYKKIRGACCESCFQ
ncbi:MAG: GIY-YIG nuclease family protein [Spirochaetia bacterium]|nr:GIY-YIG nuclease family protein [Spirochaetia bacterium]